LNLGVLMLVASGFIGVSHAVTEDAVGRQRPNIVFILADDLGWRDTSIYGSTFHRTPNIDRLGQRGMRFTNAYAAAPICSPTRSGHQACQAAGPILNGRVSI